MIEEALITGFVKRANELGVPTNDAVEMYKEAARGDQIFKVISALTNKARNAMGPHALPALSALQDVGDPERARTVEGTFDNLFSLIKGKGPNQKTLPLDRNLINSFKGQGPDSPMTGHYLPKGIDAYGRPLSGSVSPDHFDHIGLPSQSRLKELFTNAQPQQIPQQPSGLQGLIGKLFGK